MKTSIKNHVLAAGSVLLIAFATMSFVSSYQEKPKPWKAPDTAKKMKNPVAKSDESLAEAKALFTKHCKSCHGSKGLGDGPKSKELDTACGDFSTKEFQDQSDGELFYKTKEGRDDMPSFKKKITDDEEIWSIVNYMRTLAK
ncbi:MAG TPA: cytochrome c [Bacteroidia bacterium]|nr:cytochrome c [Bacteroidia bacterium]